MIYVVNLLPREHAALPDGREARGPNALSDLARALIGDGADPSARLVGLRDGRPAIDGSVGTFAGRQSSGSDTDPKFRAWRPHPRAQMPPRLVAWAIQNGFLGPCRYRPTGDTLQGAAKPREEV